MVFEPEYKVKERIIEVERSERKTRSILKSRKRRKNHVDIHISCENKEKREIVEKEIRKALRKIQHLTSNKVSYVIINDDRLV